jgi:flavin reductase (DIM6/NTAB) family NADH-FMN oxidoreductase RutF
MSQEHGLLCVAVLIVSATPSLVGFAIAALEHIAKALEDRGSR